MLLAKSLNADSVIVKYVAIRQIEALFGRVPDFSDWCVQLLVQKLKDPDTKVSSTAVRILTEATEDYQCTESMIAKKPYDALRCDPAGKKLLMRFLSRPSGFEYVPIFPFLIFYSFNFYKYFYTYSSPCSLERTPLTFFI